MTKSLATIEDAFRLANEGKTLSEISRALGVSRSTVRTWFAFPLDAFYRRNPARAAGDSSLRAAHEDGETCHVVEASHSREYAYLLGQYLGDGCISAIGPRGVFKLRIMTCDDYPIIRQRTIDAIAAVMPNNKVGAQPAQGCTEIWSCSKHWPCLFPQHGPGRKHERDIVLTDWQQAIVNDYPRELVTGLIHSDGCRATNNVVTRGKPYSYPRYFFNNVSADILGIFCDTLDLIGVEWKQNRWNSISIAKKESVAYLDTFIGPKT